MEKLGIGAFRRRLVGNAFPRFCDLAEAIRGLRFVQADPIRCPARAQDLILRQRVAGYRAGDLEESFPKLDAEEGYLFAYGFMEPAVWESLRWREERVLSKREQAVIAAVGEIGEAHPRDLDERFGKRSVVNAWGGKSLEMKRVLEDLHHHGYLRVSRREKGVRIYQVAAERDFAGRGSERERFRCLVEATAHVFGPTSRRFLLTDLSPHFHLAPSRAEREGVVGALVDDGVLSAVEVDGVEYLWLRDAWPDGDVEEERVRLLAPFDPLVRDRSRFEQVWGWMYRFEAYVPATKRERGYYALPLLWGADIIGWANAKVDKGILRVEIGYVGKRPRGVAFRRALEGEVEALAVFLGLGPGEWELGF